MVRPITPSRIRARAERNRNRTDGTFCWRCGERLNDEAAVWLALSCSTTEFYATEKEAEATGCNQGCFPFGKACAKAQLRETAANAGVTA